MFICSIISLSDRWMCLDVLLSLCQIEGCVSMFIFFMELLTMCLSVCGFCFLPLVCGVR